MEIKQPFFVDPQQPGYVRGGPFDEMGGMLVGMHATEVCAMLNEHPTLCTEGKTIQARLDLAIRALEWYAPGNMDEGSLAKSTLLTVSGRQK